MAAPTPLPPLPQPNVQLTGNSGGTSQAHSPWFAAVDDTIRTGNFPALSVGGVVVLVNGPGQTLVSGFQETEVADTISAGVITPNPSTSLKQSVTNNGAFTINATGQVGDVELHITNGPTAGAVAFAGFTKQWAGDLLDTVNGHQFVVFIYGFNGATAYIIKALQ